MWRRVLDLLTRTRRPLVFFDFETSGLSGAPPVEFAALVWAPWCEPEMDPLSVRAREAAPPGLWMASAGRLNPGRKIDPGAGRVHGITDADVAKAPRWDDIEQRAFWRALAEGSGDELPAIFAGHNVAEADLAWMRTWGYLSADYQPPLIDTMRFQRHLAHCDGMPMPPVPDAAGLADGPWRRHAGTVVHCPAVSHGLRPYATSLEGLTTALFGDPADGGHGAPVDAVTSALCFWAMLDLWAPMFPGIVTGEDPHAALDAFLCVVNAPLPGALGPDGWLTRNALGALGWARGKHKGRAITCDPGYLRWCRTLPRLPTGVDGESWCSAETAALLGA